MTTDHGMFDGNGPLLNGSAPKSDRVKLNMELDPIAIIGMACRAPGNVSTSEHLWEFCSQGRSGWSEMPHSRFNHEAFYHPDPGKVGCYNTKGAHFLQDDISRFDNSFFRISDKEAAAIDPQQRILLECTYEAIENASLALESLAGRDIGVFAAQSFAEYGVQQIRDLETLPMFKTTGSADSLMSNRISYAFDLRGPSLTVDTACSSSLTAMHLACQSLRAGESSMAISGGCHINLIPDDFVAFSMSNLLSESGKSMSFDDRATSGFGRGEGVGCVILKPLAAAIRDGDKIRAVIRNSGINQDGKTVGITMPSPDAQEALIRDVYRSAHLDPLETVFVESHGTGTAVGDPIEAAAIGAVFGRSTDVKDPLYIGSLKSNIGHLEGASGVVAIIKAAMMLEKGFILPNCNFQKPNPAIPFDKWQMKVPTRQLLWPRRKPRRASINNFGFGGSNAHFILEQAPKTERFSSHDAVMAERAVYQERLSRLIVPQAELGQSRRLIILSASSEAAVKAQGKALAHYLKHHPEVLYRNIFSSLALTLQRRSLFQWRIVVSATSQAGTFEALDEHDLLPTRSTREPRIGFVFTGQGAQWYAMGRELMHTYPAYAESILYAEDILKGYGCTWSIVEELSKSKETSLLGQASLAQPVCTAVQMALVNLFECWKIKPLGVVGHSSGEIAAAYASGAIKFETGMLLAYHRGTAAAKLLEDHPTTKGAMLAIGGQRSEIDALMQTSDIQEVITACINSPQSFTMSGDEAEIDRLDRAAKLIHLFSRKLKTEVAYHSRHMMLVADYYRSCIGEIRPTTSSKVSFHSSLLGREVDGSSLGTEYWVRNLTSPVLFSDALESLCSPTANPNKHLDILIEIGPHTALKGPARQTLLHAYNSSAEIEYLPSLTRFEDAVASVFQTAAHLIKRGSRLNLPTINFPTKDPRQPTIITDLETYPWDHSKSHWHESRIARGYRFRPGKRNDILGVPVADFNDLEPRWRNIIRIDDLPWLQQHRVRQNIIYPMSGFIAMAVEAAKFRAQSRSLKAGRYLLQDIYISQPLVVYTDTDVETMAVLRPYNECAVSSSDKWDEFRILSWTAHQGWTEHCHGLITLDTEYSRPNKDAIVAGITKNCISDVKPSGLYDMVSKMGIQYGPLFTGINSLAAGLHSSTGTMTIPDTAATMPCRLETEHVIHPATLDICFQFMWPAAVGPQLNLKALYLPSSIKRVALSERIPKTPGTKLRAYGQRTSDSISSRKMTASLFVDSDSCGESSFAIEVEDLTSTRVSEEQVWQRESTLAFKLEWLPDIECISADQLRTLSPSLSTVDRTLLEEPLIMEQASLVFFERALSQVPREQVGKQQAYLLKLYDWMEHVCELGKGSSTLLQAQDAILPSAKEACLEQVSQLHTPGGELTCLIGEKLPAILREEVDPLSLLLRGDLLRDYYSSQERITRGIERASLCMDLIANHNPALMVLEIGAGTGVATFPILQTLGGYEGNRPRFLRYDYTDISSGFFDAAKERFKPWGSFLRFRLLDIEKELSAQGFSDEKYDVIVAANVLHATTLLKATMENVYRLLKPGGKLIIIEETVPALRRFPFATLPGWWLSQEKDRRDGPLISESRWDAVLRNAGFSGLDICLQDYPGDPVHSGSVMLSTAQQEQRTEDHGKVAFLTCSSEQHDKLSRTDFRPFFSDAARAWSMEEMMTLDLDKTICIFVDDPKMSFLTAMSETRLKQIKQLFQAKGVIWVTEGATASPRSPDANLISGFARSLRSENAATKLVVLQYTTGGDQSLLSLLSRIYQRTFSRGTSLSEEIDFEYMEHEGIVYVPRVLECEEVEETVVQHGRPPVPKLQPFIQCGRLLTLKHSNTGMLSDLFFEEQKIIPSASLKEDFIRIEICAMGVNFKDVIVALGQVDGHLGQECSGIVTETGSKVTTVSVGDRVCASGRETFSTILECSALQVVPIPNDMSFAEAASIPAVFCTAYYSLVTIARLQRGESVLIHAAAGGVGQAAIMISQMIGAEIYATVGSEEKRAHLIATYGIRNDRIFSSRNSRFGQQIFDITDGRGVSVVLNSLSGDLLRTSWDCVADYGRFVELGKMDIDRNSRLDMAKFSRSTTFASVDLAMLLQDRPAVIQGILAEVMDLFRGGSLKNISPINVYPIDALGLALSDLQRGKTMGKTVIEPLAGQKVQVMPVTPGHHLVRSDATYLITGGVGGLGRSMTRWLVLQGAKSIVLLSRSGHTSASARLLMNEYDGTDVLLSIEQCDVGNEDQVREVVQRCSQSRPPIRGIIHGAMVLHDKLFEQVTISEYEAVLRPKVQGAWNLHNALGSTPVDFFVMLSSAAGIIGTHGQSAYAGASTFLGAFARWRQAQNLPANALHLGVVAEVGYVAERSDRQGVISTTYSDRGLTEREFLVFLRAAMDNQHSLPEIYTSLSLDGSSASMYWTSDAKFAHLRRAALDQQGGAPNGTAAPDDQAPRPLAQLLYNADSLQVAQDIISGRLKTKLCSLLMVPEDDLDVTQAVVTYGLDSLVAVEFRNWIAREAAAGIKLLDLMTSKSFADLAALITSRSALVDQSRFPQVNGSS